MPVSFKITPGNPVSEILKASRGKSAKKSGVEMLLLGTHGRKGLSRLLLGSVAEEVIRHSAIPVMTIGPVAQHGRAKTLSAKAAITLVVATDLGANSRKAEDYALKLALRLRARVILVHSLFGALHPVIQTSMSAPGSAPGLTELLDVLKREAIQDLRRKNQVFKKAGVKCEAILADHGIRTATVILKYLKTPTTFAVMGTHSRNAVARAFLGSTVREVILSSPSPVITVASR